MPPQLVGQTLYLTCPDCVSVCKNRNLPREGATKFVELASHKHMGAGTLKAVVAITLVTCVFVIVVSPFVDLPLTVQNKVHVTLHVAHASMIAESEPRVHISSSSFEIVPLAAEADKLDILVTHRC